MEGDTPLYLASQNGQFEVVKVLLRNNADLDASCKSPLHIAAEIGNAEIIKAIIDHEGEVHAVDRNGNTVLHLAVKNGHCAFVNFLINLRIEVRGPVPNQVPAAELSQNPS